MPSGKALKIGIAGSGLAGLAAACRLAQDGHQVHVFERKNSLSIASGAIYIQSNAVRCIQRWGMEEAFRAVAADIVKTQIRNGYTNEVLSSREYSSFSKVPAWGSDREAIQSVFYAQAQKHGVTFSFGTAIKEIQETSDQAIVTCGDGETLELDLFLAADGISSHLRANILPQYDPARLALITAPSTIYPTEIPKDALLSHELTRTIILGEESQDSLVFVGKNGYVVAKYNHSRQLLNIMWAIKHEIGSDEEKNPRLFDEDGDPEDIRKFFSSWHPTLRALAGMTTSCSRWRLARLEPLETWSSAGRRLVLLGDSAHAMLPDIAQGFSSIIEDIDALSVMLEGRADVQQAVQLWERVRTPRVTKLQGISAFNHDCFNRGVSPVPSLTEEQKKLPADHRDAEAPFNSPPFMRWMYDYDTAEEARKYLIEEESTAKSSDGERCLTELHQTTQGEGRRHG